MQFYLISDNVDTQMGMRLAGIEGVVVHEPDEVKKAVREAESELGENGRVLVRVSGTEPLVRVMLEGRDKTQIETLAGEIAEVVRERLI